MTLPWLIGCRYARAAKTNNFIGFISVVSILGLTLGVLVLITVVAVMKGFQTEITQQILVSAPQLVLQPMHIDEKSALRAAERSSLQTAERSPTQTAEQSSLQADLTWLAEQPAITSVLPYVTGNALLSHEAVSQPVLVRGIDLDLSQLDLATAIPGLLIPESMPSLQAGQYQVILSRQLAIDLGVAIGDEILLLVPGAKVSPLGFTPRMRTFRIAGYFAEANAIAAKTIYLNAVDARKLYKLAAGSISEIQLRLAQPLQAMQVERELLQQLKLPYFANNWIRDFSNLFQALQMERVVMWLILFLIIAVAAFNLVASLVMLVTEKRADIALLRVLGASKLQVMQIFVSQGLFIGLLGTSSGCVLGCALAVKLGDLVAFLERSLHLQILNAEIYFGLSKIPSELQLFDVALICGAALLLSGLATLYPAWTASKISPALALKYD